MDTFVPSEEEVDALMADFENSLEAQKKLFESQVDQFHQLVINQIKLTGVNPLADEMAADVLSMDTQRNAGNSLSEDAVKYMNSIFAIKDILTKSEVREISARFGITQAQVQEYFASLRSMVKESIRMAAEIATESFANKETQKDAPAKSDSIMPKDPLPSSSIASSIAKKPVSCLKPEDILTEPEKTFVNTIFDLIREAKTFTRKEELMQEILKMENIRVLCWFVVNGGLITLNTWLNEATEEDQYSFIGILLEVLAYLPLHKALPDHMSDIIIGVNKLRWWDEELDLADKARKLTLKWNRDLGRCDGSKGPKWMTFSSDESEEDPNQPVDSLDDDGSSESEDDLSEDDIVSSFEIPEDIHTRNPNVEAQKSAKLPAAPSDDSNRERGLGFRNKQRRKVLLVEQPRQKAVGKRKQPSKAAAAASASRGRPITNADEIQKGKLRAQVRQSKKHGKAGSSSNTSQTKRSERQRRPSSLLTGDMLRASEAHLRLNGPKVEARKKAKPHPSICTSTKKSESRDNKKGDSKLKVNIMWRTPPEIQINPEWRVGSGVNSKELDVQRSRTRRENEEVYQTLQDIPSNPKEPWDVELDYDDSLTEEIPIEQLPEVATSEPIPAISEPIHATSEPTPATSSQPGSSSKQPEPDLELLAVLLKNPDLVFALTSGQATGLSSEETVKLLDRLRLSGGIGGLSAPAGTAAEKRAVISLPSPTPVTNIKAPLPSPMPILPSRAETSLPSFTPSSYPATSGSRVEAAQNPAMLQIPPHQNFKPQNPAQVPSTRTIPHPSLPISPRAEPPAQPHLLSPQQQPHSIMHEPVMQPHHRPILNAGPMPSSWQERQVVPSQPYPQGNYNRMIEATGLPPSLPGSSWPRNEAGYWQQRQARGRSHPGPRNSGRGRGPPDWSRHRDSGGNRGRQHGRK